jgi:hypothetical protein
MMRIWFKLVTDASMPRCNIQKSEGSAMLSHAGGSTPASGG